MLRILIISSIVFLLISPSKGHAQNVNLDSINAKLIGHWYWVDSVKDELWKPKHGFYLIMDGSKLSLSCYPIDNQYEKEINSKYKIKWDNKSKSYYIKLKSRSRDFYLEGNKLEIISFEDSILVLPYCEQNENIRLEKADLPSDKIKEFQDSLIGGVWRYHKLICSDTIQSDYHIPYPIDSSFSISFSKDSVDIQYVSNEVNYSYRLAYSISYYLPLRSIHIEIHRPDVHDHELIRELQIDSINKNTMIIDESGDIMVKVVLVRTEE